MRNAGHPPDARTLLRDAAEAATTARRDVRHLLEGLESILVLRATPGLAKDIDRLRELVDDLRAARRTASVSLRRTQELADGALHAIGGEAPAARARARTRRRTEQKARRR